MLRDEIIEKVAKELGQTEELVDLVVSWSYEKANKATKVEKEIEFSGFGKILVSKAKVSRRKKKLEGILQGTLNKEESENKEKRLKTLNKKLDNLKKYED